MENASKALIIAGSILLSILIIALGMYIFSTSSSTTDVSVLSETEVQTFNTKFDKYAGQQSGSNVNALIKVLIANASSNKKVKEKLPTLNQTGMGSAYPSAATGAATAVSNIDTYLNNLNKISEGLEKSHNYTVSLKYNSSGLVSEITIKY